METRPAIMHKFVFSGVHGWEKITRKYFFRSCAPPSPHFNVGTYPGDPAARGKRRNPPRKPHNLDMGGGGGGRSRNLPGKLTFPLFSPIHGPFFVIFFLRNVHINTTDTPHTRDTTTHGSHANLPMPLGTHVQPWATIGSDQASAWALKETSCVRRSQVTVRSCKTQGILHACRRHNCTPQDL